jgi:hypothetical protein
MVPQNGPTLSKMGIPHTIDSEIEYLNDDIVYGKTI